MGLKDFFKPQPQQRRKTSWDKLQDNAKQGLMSEIQRENEEYALLQRVWNDRDQKLREVDYMLGVINEGVLSCIHEYVNTIATATDTQVPLDCIPKEVYAELSLDWIQRLSDAKMLDPENMRDVKYLHRFPYVNLGQTDRFSTYDKIPPLQLSVEELPITVKLRKMGGIYTGFLVKPVIPDAAKNRYGSLIERLMSYA